MRRMLYALLIAVVCAFNAPAQEAARLSGLITDSSGAVIPEASVGLRNQETGTRYTTTSNSSGIYTFAFVIPGMYEVTVEKTGFKTMNRTNIKLDVSQNARIDCTLEIGSTTQTVEVTASAPTVNTSDATVSEVVTGKQVVDLNLNGRDYETLITLVPGASPDNVSGSQVKTGIPFALTEAGGDSVVPLSFNGGRVQANTFYVDGSDTADDSGGGWSTVVIPDIDSIAEFRISTSNYGADVGKRSAAVTMVATKSGTKDFHGAAFEFVRNDAMDANPWFANNEPWSGLPSSDCGGSAAGPCKAPRTALKYNDFGFNIGGPFYIPGSYNTSKSKTFFFWSETWGRYRNGTVMTANVPTPRMRGGDFSECDHSSANFNAVAASNCTLPINRATDLPFAADTVPINSNAATLLNSFVPLPDSGVIGWTAAPDLPSNSRRDSLRIDQNINEKTSVFIHMTQGAWNQSIEPSLWTSSNFSSVTSLYTLPAKNAVIHLTRTFKPDLMNEVVYAFVNDIQSVYSSVGPGSVSGSIDKPSTWTAGMLFAGNEKNPLLPAINVCGGTPFCFDEDPFFVPHHNFSAGNTLTDNMVYTVNKHTLKMGISVFVHHADGMIVGTDPEGSYTFQARSPSSTGNALADMYSGIIDNYTEGSFVAGGEPIGGRGWGRERRISFEPYVQDDWKATRKLTLNLGVRYYYFTPQHDVSTPSTDSDFFPSEYNPAAQAQLSSSGTIVSGTGYNYTVIGNGLVECGSGGVKVGCRNMPGTMFAPRFGFAFDPKGDGKTSVRGGYGIFYDIGRGEGQAFDAEGDPPAAYTPTVYNVVGYQNIAPGPLYPTGFSVWPENGPWIQSQQFNLTVQHEFKGSNTVSVGWVGSLGRHLTRTQNWNRIADGAGTMSVPELAGTTGCDASGNCNVQQILINQNDPATFFVPYRGYTSIKAQEFAAGSNYNSLQAVYRHPFGHGSTYQLAYTYAHALDNSSNYNATVGVDDSNIERWYGSSDFNRTQTLIASYIYALPFFRDSANHFLKTGLGGWEFSGITSFFSGLPVDFNCGATGLQSGIGNGMRCNTLGPLKIQKGTFNDPTYGPVPTWFNPALIEQPLSTQYTSNGQAGMFGYLGRNLMTGPGRNNWDLSLHKNFETPWFAGEHSSLQFRFETFNTFNHTQWDSINASCGGNTPAGTPCSGITNNLGNGEVNNTYSPRTLQLGLKFLF